jgi:hypothetical protein
VGSVMVIIWTIYPAPCQNAKHQKQYKHFFHKSFPVFTLFSRSRKNDYISLQNTYSHAVTLERIYQAIARSKYALIGN